MVYSQFKIAFLPPCYYSKNMSPAVCTYNNSVVSILFSQALGSEFVFLYLRIIGDDTVGVLPLLIGLRVH